MDETVRRYLDAARGRLLGRSVTQKRHFLLTLQLYFEPEGPGSPAAEVWCEPSWQVLVGRAVVAGSGTLELAPEASDSDAEYARVSAATDVLVGRRLRDLNVDPRTHELQLAFDGPGDVEVRTFVSIAAEPDPLWRLRERALGTELAGRVSGVSVAAV
ncbi:MAG TPA: hypothetical protein VNT33_07585 [Telluria sp.]|nr:hypothetical protein [Telluria sp.]